MIFNMTGGGAALNYKLYALAAAPMAAGNENDIALVTETPIGDIQINCVSAPTTRSDGSALQTGDIYISALTTSVATFNVLKKNAFYGLPGSCYQRVEESWTPIAAHIYKSGWVQFSNPNIPLSSVAYSGGRTLTDEGDGNWNMKITSSGTLTLASGGYLDVFLVGGGGGGTQGFGVGGGGGYTATHLAHFTAQGDTAVVVGGGGSFCDGYGTAGSGGVSSFGALSVSGGYGGEGGTCVGGAGGSGGGSWNQPGGQDGANGGSSSRGAGGNGQGTTTRAWGLSTGALYSSGGGGEDYGGTPYSANTGNGSNGKSYQTGCSGIVLVRNARYAS